jgi:hypothetical protein
MDQIVIAFDRAFALAAARLAAATAGNARHERSTIELTAWFHCNPF